MQAIDFRWEILFLGLVLVSILVLITAAGLAIGGRRWAATRWLAALGIGWVVYLAIVFVGAARTPQQSVAFGQDLCFDEMCFAVVNVQTAREIGAARSQGVFHIVSMRVSSRARGKAQAELGIRAQLWSPEHRWEISPEGQRAWDAAHPQNRPLTARVQPGESVLSDQVFDVPERASPRGVVIEHGFGPAYLVVGECPLFHPPLIWRVGR